MKSRVLQTNEVLFEDSTQADALYFLIRGSLRIEKEVEITNQSFWPINT